MVSFKGLTFLLKKTTLWLAANEATDTFQYFSIGVRAQGKVKTGKGASEINEGVAVVSCSWKQSKDGVC